MSSPLRSSLFALAIVSPFSFGFSADFKIEPDRKDGLYQAGENVTWSIEAVGTNLDQKLPESASFVLLSNGLNKLYEGNITLTGGKATFTATRQDPGTLLLTVQGPGLKGVSGAAFDPLKLSPSLPMPADFEAFWREKLGIVSAIPLNPELKSAQCPNPAIELWEVTLDNLGKTKVRGQLARPTAGVGKLPAMLIFQWAGVYPLQKDWVIEPASKGWLVFQVMAHDLPLYESKEFYDQQSREALKSYPFIGSEDRETSYYLRMYLGCFQALRYLKSRPDWDGRILVVRGTSQGGMQALATAGLAALQGEPVTAVLANVPAGCDQNGPLAGRAPGWPQWYHQTEGRDSEKVRHTAQYFDAVNFCQFSSSPTLIGMGLADTTCPAPGVFVAANQIRSQVRTITMPSTGHRPTELNSQEKFYSEEKHWLSELREGRLPSIKPGENDF